MPDRFAVVTGASSGIGLELAKLAASAGYDLLVDLSTFEGVDRLVAAADDRPIDVLCANSGHGLGGRFIDQEPSAWRHVVDTNVVGTVYLLQCVVKQMVARKEGKILVTGSLAGYMPGPFNMIYNGTKAFIDNIVPALRNELQDVTGITITNLLPAVTGTDFYSRAGMLDTPVGELAEKDDAGRVARAGWDGMLAGGHNIVPGFRHKVEAVMTALKSEDSRAAMHRQSAIPNALKD